MSESATPVSTAEIEKDFFARLRDLRLRAMAPVNHPSGYILAGSLVYRRFRGGLAQHWKMKPKLIPFPLKNIFIIDGDCKITAVAANPHRDLINYLVHLGSMITFNLVADLLQLPTDARLDIEATHEALTVEATGALHVMHTAHSHTSLPTAGQSISSEAITDFMSTTISSHRRHHIPSLQRNKAGREPSHVCVRWHTGQPLNGAPPRSADSAKLS